jgi:hypothetical protein
MPRHPDKAATCEESERRNDGEDKPQARGLGWRVVSRVTENVPPLREELTFRQHAMLGI